MSVTTGKKFAVDLQDTHKFIDYSTLMRGWNRKEVDSSLTFAQVVVSCRFAPSTPNARTTNHEPLDVFEHFPRTSKTRASKHPDHTLRHDAVLAAVHAAGAATLYPHLSLLLVGSGMLFMAWFFTMQVSNGKKTGTTAAEATARVVKEITVAAIASSLLGFGLLFLCLNVGIYV